jgi:nucleotide-binding universal stress UspA family protein
LEAVHALKYFAQAEQVTVLHALNAAKSVQPMMATRGDMEEYAAHEQSMKEEGERLLDRVQSLLPMNAGPSTKHLRIGAPEEVIVSMAEQQKADLIVMGARGVSPIKEWLLGSVSHRIITMAHCAALIVHGPVKAMKQVLLPIHDQSDGEAAMRFLQLKPFHDAVEFTLLTVSPSTEPPLPAGSIAAAAAAEILETRAAYIETLAVRLRAMGYQAHGVAVVGAPATVILQQATTLRSDLILMGTRGRQGIARFVLGSVSHAVLHKMPCPVLAFHL